VPIADDDRTLRRTDFAALYPISTRWSDVDIYGHLNNAVYYLLIDTAVNGWLMSAAGTDIRALPGIGVVAETSCRYYTELDFPVPIIVGIGLERVGTTSVIYRLAIFGDRDEPAAVGRFVHVYVDPQTRRPVPIPPEIGAVLSQLRPR
jgi:acyl-CoA thioester hydrolase